MKYFVSLLLTVLLSLNVIISQTGNLENKQSNLLIESSCTPFTIIIKELDTNFVISKEAWEGYIPNGKYNFIFRCRNEELSHVIIMDKITNRIYLTADFGSKEVDELCEFNIIDDEPGKPPQIAEVVDYSENECINQVYIIVEEMPLINGKKLSIGFPEYVQKNLIYPEEAAKLGVEGEVFVRFTVDCHGNVMDVAIARSTEPLLEEEAVRLVKESKEWTPGKQRGTPVNVQFTIKIEFSLK